HHRVATENPAGQLFVERELQPVSDNALMRSSQPRGEGDRGGLGEDVSDLEVLEIRSTDHVFAHSPALFSTRRALTASASSSIWPSSTTAPTPRADASAKESKTLRAWLSSTSEGVNASRAAGTWQGWMTHVPSKPTARAVRRCARKSSSSTIPRWGPSMASRSCVRAAVTTRSRTDSHDALCALPSDAARSA